MRRLCRLFGVSPSGFYAAQVRPESRRAQEDRRLKVLLHASYRGGRGYYGSPRILDDFIEWGEHVSRKRIIRLTHEEGLQARARKRYKTTTDSDHQQPIADNLLQQDFTAERPNQRWVGDTSELRIGEQGKAYLAVILDLFSRFVVGWSISAVNDRHLTIKALEMALKRRCPGVGLLHHSDRGSTYASEDYQDVLTAAGVTCSMSRRALDPFRWTRSERWIRCPACLEAVAAGARAGNSQMSSKREPYGWSSTKGKRLEPSPASSI